MPRWGPREKSLTNPSILIRYSIGSGPGKAARVVIQSSGVPWEYSHAWTRGRGPHPSELFAVCSLLPSYRPGTHRYPLSSESLLDSALMSYSHTTASSSSGLRLIISNALKSYQKHTKIDLLTHPLASQPQAYDSPGAILAFLQQQVQGLDQSQITEDRWINSLDPTVKVLFSYSATLGSVVGQVCSSTYLNCTLSRLYDSYFLHSLSESVFSFQCVSPIS